MPWPDQPPACCKPQDPWVWRILWSQFSCWHGQGLQCSSYLLGQVRLVVPCEENQQGQEWAPGVLDLKHHVFLGGQKLCPWVVPLLPSFSPSGMRTTARTLSLTCLLTFTLTNITKTLTFKSTGLHPSPGTWRFSGSRTAPKTCHWMQSRHLYMPIWAIDHNCNVLPLSLDDLLNYTTLLLKFCTNKPIWASLLRQVFFEGGERRRFAQKKGVTLHPRATDFWGKKFLRKLNTYCKLL